MSIRLTKVDIAMAAAQYNSQNPVKPEQDLKIRMKCALEALIHFGKAFYHAIASVANSKNPLHESQAKLFAKQALCFAASVIDPKKYLPEYIKTLPAEGLHRAANFLNKVAARFGLDT